jgi:hypothetical protein
VKHRRSKRRRRLLLALALVEPLLLWVRGYPIGGRMIVRCRRGHLFTTLWLPGVSVKALRLGWLRFQRCPVGHHWSLITPVRDSELTEAEKSDARARRDIFLP